MSYTAFLWQIGVLIRLPNSFTVVANVLAAYLIGTGLQIHGSTLMSLLVISLCFYHGGIILNDCLDQEEDKKNRLKRPLVTGLITKSFAWILLGYLFVFGLALLISFDKKTQLAGIALVACICAYNFSSRSGILGCFLMGLCRGLNWLLVLWAVGAKLEVFHYAILVGLYVTSLTFISRDEHYANRRSLLYLSAFALLIVNLLFLYNFDYDTSLLSAKISAFLFGWAYLMAKLVSLYHDYTPERIRGMIKLMILGMIPLDACLLFVSGYYVESLFVLGLLIPSRALAKRMYVT